MIKANARFFNNAHRLSFKLASSVTGDVKDGQFLTLNTSGEAVISTGAANAFSMMTISSRYGTFDADVGAPITNAPAGRDTITSTGMVTCLIGPYNLITDQYETGTYVNGIALKVSANGKVMPWVSGTDSPQLIVGYCSKIPTGSDLTVGIFHE